MKHEEWSSGPDITADQVSVVQSESYCGTEGGEWRMGGDEGGEGLFNGRAAPGGTNNTTFSFLDSQKAG